MSTTALTKTQLQYWQDTSWHWQPLSSEGHWKPYPSPQPFPALLLPQPPLRLCSRTQGHTQAFCTNLRGGAAGRLLVPPFCWQAQAGALRTLSDLQVTSWGTVRHVGDRGPRAPHASSTHPEQ